MTMSEKDKNTLIIAVIALLIFGIAFLGIKPAFGTLKETKAKNAELSATKETMQTEINSLPTYKTNLDAAKVEYQKTADRVFDCKTNDKIHDVVVDKLITPLGLETTSLTINGVSPMGVTKYDISGETPVGGITEGSVNLANVTVTVSGNYNQIVSFIDELNETEGTYFDGVSISESADIMAFSVSFYMVISDTFA